MGSMGSDAAIEAADVVIMDDRLLRIPAVIRVARKTVRISRQNIVFALTVKFLILVLGALGFANMWAAVFADVGVAVICILNSMRLIGGIIQQSKKRLMGGVRPGSMGSGRGSETVVSMGSDPET